MSKFKALISRVIVPRNFLSTSFAKDVAKLSMGTLSGRVISVLALPLLTRLYTPEDFAFLATYIALVSVISVVACLRFEVAIPLIKSDADAAKVLTLALLAQFTITICVLIVVLLIPDLIAHLLGAPKIASFLWLVPIGIVFASTYSAMQYWATRNKHFGKIAITRISQSIVGVITMLTLGLMGFSSAGLIFGNILNMGAGGGALLVSTFRQGVFSYRKLRPRNLLKAFIRYRRYPLLSTPEALLNIAGYQIPIIIIASHAGPEAGFLTLAIQLMAAPMSLLGTSVSQVYISRARKEYQDGRLAFFTISIMKRLVLVGVSPLIILGAVAPIFFPYVFGQNWVRAGEMVSLLTPWMILQFIGSPVSMVMYVVDRQGLMILLTSIGFLLRIGSVLTSIYLINGSPITGLILGNVGYYFTVIGFVIFAAKISSRQFFSLLSVFIDWRVLISLATAFFIYIN